MMDRHNPDCGQCGGPFIRIGGAPGYGTRPDGVRVCYACCAENDERDMIATGKATLYLVKTGRVDRMAMGLDKPFVWEVSNWPGTWRRRTFGAPQAFNHPFTRHAVIAYFAGPDGFVWSARNIGDSQIAHCRRLKERA